MRALVIGGGIFGVTAALALRERGWRVTLVDPNETKLRRARRGYMLPEKMIPAAIA